jgi:predicted dehydrogenase
MDKPPLRWGILGTANIARKNWKAIWNSGNGCVTAVASRDAQRSRRFIDECQAQAGFSSVPRALGSYDTLLEDPEVDAVYLPLPTGVRALWARRAAEAGKHVVCEKPCGVNLAELTGLLDTCRQHKVQFMDGVMFNHSLRLERVRQVLDDHLTVGPIRRITSAFSFLAEPEFYSSNIRAKAELEPYGCLGDLGWYCIRFALWALNWRLPARVSGSTLSEFKPPGSNLSIPTEFSADLHFEGGVSSSFYCSFLTGDEQWVHVSGERGHLWMPDFVLPFSGNRIGFETGSPQFRAQGCDFEMQPQLRRWEVDEFSHGHPNAQETNLFRNFAGQVQSGSLNPLWPEMALKTQQVMEVCLESARLAAALPLAGDRAC